MEQFLFGVFCGMMIAVVIKLLSEKKGSNRLPDMVNPPPPPPQNRRWEYVDTITPIRKV